jgi:hypothetical protein
MTTESKPEGDKPSSLQHSFRISLNLTRRIVRRMIELEQVQHTYVWKAPVRPSNVPDPVSFQFSLRILRRVIHRVMEQQASVG